MRAPFAAFPRAMSLAAALLLAGLATGCDRKADEPPPPENDRPVARLTIATADGADPYAGATPVTERVAVLGLLNKRNGLVRDITLKPGESLRVGRAVIRLRNCERTAQWESPPETGAFVQLLVLEHSDQKWHRVFSGWLFKERPDRNVVQHPIYDVFVRSCTMRWPGEVEVTEDEEKSPSPAAPAPATKSGDAASSANQSPAAVVQSAPAAAADAPGGDEETAP